MQGPANDRLIALRQLSPADLAELLRRVPELPDAIAGNGLLAPINLSSGRQGAHGLPATLPALARLLASVPGAHATVATLNRFQLQLATLAKWHGGSLTRDQALVEAGSHNDEALDTAANTLERLVLADRSRTWLALRPGVADVVGLPGLPVRPYLERNNSERLADRLRALGERPPARKPERVDALEACLRDPATVKAALADAPEGASRLLRLLVEHGPQSLSDLGEPRYGVRRDSPLHWLWSRNLVILDDDEDVCVWLDVITALTSSLFPAWDPDPAPVEPRPLAVTAPQLPPVLTQLTALLDLWAREPAPALSAGGLGVRPIRAAAKALGLPSGSVGLLAHLALAMGLVGTVQTGVHGTGRNRTVDWAYAPTRLAAAFAELPAAERWVRLVQAWRDDWALDEATGLPERVAGEAVGTGGPEARKAVLDTLCGLPEGHGVTADELVELAGFGHPGLLVAERARGVVEAVRVLGLVPPGEPVGLTTLARAALTGVESVEAALPAPSTTFTVQADHTIVAPPDLAPALTAALERYAVCESDAGARVYRLDETKLAQALDAGETADSIVAFLRDHATAPVAQNVTHLITDVARRHGRLRAGACQSYVRSEDPSLLARAVAVKPAKLRTVAPTVAVSTLPRSKLVAALRAKGLVPVAEDADGVALTEAPTVADTAWGTDDVLPELPPPAPNRADTDALAKRLLEHPDDDSAPSGQLLLLPGGERL